MNVTLARRALLGSARLSAVYLGTTRLAHQRTNYCPNPNLESGLTGWSLSAGTGGVAVATRELSGGYSGAAFYRITWTTAPTGVDEYLWPPNNPIPAALPYTLSLYVRPSATVSTYPRLQVYNGATTTYDSYGTAPAVSCPAGVWTRLSITRTAAAGDNYMRIFAALVAAPPLGFTLDGDAVLVEQSSTLGDYFDGTQPVWAGTVNASAAGWRVARTNLCPNPRAVSTGSAILAALDTVRVVNWVTSFPVAHPLGITTGISSHILTTGSGSFALYSTNADGLANASPVARQLGFWVMTQASGYQVASMSFTGQAAIPLTPGVWTFVKTANAVAANVLAQIGVQKIIGADQNDLIYVTGVLAENVTASVGTYFDGSTIGSGWTGTAHASTSVQWSRTNLARNPRAVSTGSSCFLPNNSYWTKTYVTSFPVPHPLGITTGVSSMVLNAVGAGNQLASWYNIDGQGNPGVTRQAGVWVMTPDSGYRVVAYSGFSAQPLVPNVWVFVRTTSATSANTGMVVSKIVGNPDPTDIAYFTGVLCEAGAAQVGDYFDALYPTPEWSGTANASPSTWWVAA